MKYAFEISDVRGDYLISPERTVNEMLSTATRSPYRFNSFSTWMIDWSGMSRSTYPSSGAPSKRWTERFRPRGVGLRYQL